MLWPRRKQAKKNILKGLRHALDDLRDEFPQEDWRRTDAYAHIAQAVVLVKEL